jgi:cold-inducible RNA-binding protein
MILRNAIRNLIVSGVLLISVLWLGNMIVPDAHAAVAHLFHHTPTQTPDSAADDVPTRIYVGNISFSTTRESLEATLSSCGTVIAISIPTDRETGQPRGFAFVTMSSAQAAQCAISQLNNTVLDGRHLKINLANTRPR